MEASSPLRPQPPGNGVWNPWRNPGSRLILYSANRKPDVVFLSEYWEPLSCEEATKMVHRRKCVHSRVRIPVCLNWLTLPTSPVFFAQAANPVHMCRLPIQFICEDCQYISYMQTAIKFICANCQYSSCLQTANIFHLCKLPVQLVYASVTGYRLGENLHWH